MGQACTLLRIGAPVRPEDAHHQLNELVDRHISPAGAPETNLRSRVRKRVCSGALGAVEAYKRRAWSAPGLSAVRHRDRSPNLAESLASPAYDR